jgi:hypothetical protein
MRATLEDLRREIFETDPLNWLYPSDGGVLGFEGPGPVMILSYRPSSTWTRADLGRKRLYGAPSRAGLSAPEQRNANLGAGG